MCSCARRQVEFVGLSGGGSASGFISMPGLFPSAGPFLSSNDYQLPTAVQRSTAERMPPATTPGDDALKFVVRMLCVVRHPIYALWKVIVFSSTIACFRYSEANTADALFQYAALQLTKPERWLFGTAHERRLSLAW